MRGATGCPQSCQEGGLDTTRLLPIYCPQTDTLWKSQLSRPLRTTEAPTDPSNRVSGGLKMTDSRWHAKLRDKASGEPRGWGGRLPTVSPSGASRTPAAPCGSRQMWGGTSGSPLLPCSLLAAPGTLGFSVGRSCPKRELWSAVSTSHSSDHLEDSAGRKGKPG